MIKPVEREVLQLSFQKKRNSKTGEPQWQARVGKILYVPHRTSEQPKYVGQLCDCVTGIGIGMNIVTVTITKLHTSQTQRRKQNRLAGLAAHATA